ncbi:YeiH family protein [Amphibacillus indicireducens]|uniref:YeiH family protein n=1 Tax=Amphibacillus indicireducens TaxID=1076330 RepID=A0ABP7V1L2_9BACI
MRKILAYIPGLLLALIIAFFARSIESTLPFHIIGDSVLALFIGIVINQIWKPNSFIEPGLNFTAKRVLKFSIVLLGASLSINTVLNVSGLSLTVMLFTFLTAFGGGFLLGKWLGLDWKRANLINAGTGICGGSAIAALAPVINAKDKDIAYAISVTFLFDMLMIILFPIIGRALGLTDMAYGLWTGTSVNDTSSVVATGYAFSEAAGDFATMVKLTRTLTIIPTVLVFSVISARLEAKTSPTARKKVKITGLIPWFIVAFIGMSLINSFGLFSMPVSTALKNISRFLMVAALAAIGLKTDLKELKKLGPNPLIHSVIVSTLMAIVALIVIYFINI